MTLHTVKTEEDLLRAYEGESRAKWTYKAFADKADSNGSPEVAKLFRAASESEEIHAACLLRSFKETSRATSDLWKAGMYDPKMVHDSVEDNLREAIRESRGLSDMYRDMVRDAEKDGWEMAATCFRYAGEVDSGHEKLFSKALDSIGKGYKGDYCICEGCGNTLEHKPSGSCSVCGSSESSFRTIH